MTEHAKTHIRKRRKLLAGKRRKIRLLLLALVLFLGSGALLFHKDKFSILNEMLSCLKQSNPGEVIASTLSSPIRGDIYDRNFRPLATTYKTYAICARPLEMEDPDFSAGQLAEILGLKKSELLPKFKSERGFIWVAKGIDQKTADTVKQRNIKGIDQIVETKRFYPNSQKAAHAVGFVENGQGLDGIEFQYNTILRGDEISNAELKTLNFVPETEFGESSTHLVLNLDLMIQSKIERFLDKRMKITGASSGTAILMNANTGAVLALASFPSFNPNRYWEFSSSALRNHALTEPVYPGELGRIFQQAAAFNLKNEKKSDSIENSDEINSVKIIVPEKQKRRRFTIAPRVDYVDPVYLAQFAQLLGFSQKPLTDLPLKGETPVSTPLVLNNPSFNSSALRLLNGFTALVNGGRLVTPHLLHKAYQKDSTTSFETTLEASEQRVVLNSDTTKDLTDFLAAKWLKLNRRTRTADTPMFFEGHRFTTTVKNTAYQRSAQKENEPEEQIPYLTQSVMLGAIPGEDPKLTMIAVLSYPDNCDGIYPDALEAFGNRFSILIPDKDMIQKMLHVAAMPPPNPSPDFWGNEGTMFAKNSNSHALVKIDPAALSNNLYKSMPDVTGRSLRAGLQVLQHLNLNIKLVGSGRIVSQRPPAGTELINVDECILEMQQEI
ncbi:MAG: penicillin-binding transpeptidase domain-containing protein [Thermodesulfobacteriota bacterium]